jgi:hypothetical protein
LMQGQDIIMALSSDCVKAIGQTSILQSKK